jgi:hypothetical protein
MQQCGEQAGKVAIQELKILGGSEIYERRKMADRALLRLGVGEGEG